MPDAGQMNGQRRPPPAGSKNSDLSDGELPRETIALTD